jgi:hypothetical protein
MKERIFSLLKKILTILILATTIFAAYEYISVRVKGYPREMHLMDRQYRIIPINLTGSTSTHLYATRRDTKGSFIYKIEDLHFINQWRMHLYPTTSNLGKSEEYTNSKSHAEQTLTARDRLIEAAKKLQAKVEATESNVLVRSFEQELAGELQKIRDLETRLDNYDFDYDPYNHVDNRGGLLESLTDVIDRIAIREDPTAE